MKACKNCAFRGQIDNTEGTIECKKFQIRVEQNNTCIYHKNASKSKKIEKLNKKRNKK